MASREEISGLVSLVDRLERLLERSALSEIEVEADGISVILRSPAAIAALATGSSAGASGVVELVEAPAPLDEPVPSHTYAREARSMPARSSASSRP
jgi:hypothetical protein